MQPFVQVIKTAAGRSSRFPRCLAVPAVRIIAMLCLIIIELSGEYSSSGIARGVPNPRTN